MNSDLVKNNRTDVSQIGNSQDWDYTCVPGLKDIKYWQIIHYYEDLIGVFAAENPYVEYYVIIHYAFPNLDETVEHFFGSDASSRCCSRMHDFGIMPRLYTSWSNLISSKQP